VKIIARISTDRLLVEMTEREIANVAGHISERHLAAHQWEHKRDQEPLRIGTEYKVSLAWDRLQQQAKAAEQLEGVSKTLAALSDLVTQTKVQFTNATVATEGNGGAQ
jgi:hypothetical protein